MEPRRNNWIVIIGIVFLIAVMLIGIPFIVNNIIQRAVDKALSPVEQTSQQLKTQVSNLLYPTPTIIPDPITIVHEMRALARLETMQYSIEKVITAEVGQGEFAFLFGDRLLFVAHGVVIAGIDMDRMGADDIWYEGDAVHMRVPDAEVFIATLDNQKSYVYDRTTGILTKGDTNLETAARQVAEKEIQQAAEEDGILDQAQINAEVYLMRLMDALGHENVIFEYEEPLP
jgi:hypothetical protein